MSINFEEVLTERDEQIVGEVLYGWQSYKKTKAGIIFRQAGVFNKFRKLNKTLPSRGDYLFNYKYSETPVSQMADIASSTLEISFKLLT
jgi:hypothetical protein